MTDKKYILFDLDGTLTDPQEGITNSIKYALEFYKIHETDYEKLLKFIGPPLVESFKENYGFDDKKAFEAVIKYREYFLDKGMFENKIIENIDELLEKLYMDEKTNIIVTSKPESMAKDIARHFKIDKYFYDICGATLDEKLSKKIDILKMAVEKNAIDIKNAVMIGDREFDVLAAKHMNMNSIGVLFGFGSREELENAGADIIVESVDELYNVLCRK